MKLKIISILLTVVILICSMQSYVLATSEIDTYFYKEEIIYEHDYSNDNSNDNNSNWDTELSSTLSISCDWLSNQNEGDLLYLTLGSSGKASSSIDVTYYINDISLKNRFSSLLQLSYAILNSTFCGYSATNILGKNLINQFKNFKNLDNQSLDTLCYALLAINSNPYDVGDKFDIEACIDYILKYQNADGGFKLSNNTDKSNITSTALALIALSEYKQDAKISNAIKKGLDFISKNQNEYGDFEVNGQPSSIPLSYVIIALCSLNITLNPSEFNHTSESLTSLLVHKYSNIDGSFAEQLNGEGDIYATQLAILALTASKENKSPFKLDRPLVVNSIKIQDNTINTDKNNSNNNDVSIISIALVGVLLLSLLVIILYFKRKNR